jgi:uncharacterized protein (TIGR03084 family)
VTDTAASIAADLRAEQGALDDVVANLPDEAWATPTPSAGWSVADQIGHLTYFDGAASLAITEPDAFRESVTSLFDAVIEGRGDELTLHRHLSPPELLDAWRGNRQRLLDDAAGLADGDRVPWYGPSMSARSFLTARLMETWAHGQDVVDALGADRPVTDRLRHVAQIGVITRGWSYANRGLEAPDVPVRVELVAPSGGTWTWGPEDATDTVQGAAVDFCLVVTQRRHAHDTDLVVQGDAARDWMEKAQAFAGPPTEGPRPSGEAG